MVMASKYSWRMPCVCKTRQMLVINVSPAPLHTYTRHRPETCPQMKELPKIGYPKRLHKTNIQFSNHSSPLSQHQIKLWNVGKVIQTYKLKSASTKALQERHILGYISTRT